MNERHILIVDDDPDIAEAIELILQLDNYKVTTAYTGGDGLIKSLADSPDLILLDYMLPDMNGKEVALALQSDQKLKHIPIIMISASREAGEIVKQLHLSDFIEKPFDMDILLATVRKHVHKNT